MAEGSKMDIKKIGLRIRRLRVERDFKQKKLAQILKIDRSTLSRIESGTNTLKKKEQEGTMEHEKIIRDAKELLKFPDIGKSLFHKIEELKGILSENIEKYCPLIEKHPKRKTSHTPEGTRFELRRIGEKLWVPSIPENRRCNAYAVIPQPIIDYIVNHRKKTGVIYMKPGLRFSDLPGQVYDLIFEKTSQKYIWGIIQERQENLSEFIYPNGQAVKYVSQDVGENSDKKEVLKLVLYYLLNNQDYYTHVTAEFFYHWKPLIDCQLITATAM
jgi:transcriptional regulator with XRE-family HTH domain